jgi:hypothetical protein
MDGKGRYLDIIVIKRLYLHRAPVAHPKIRVRLPVRLGGRVSSPRGCQEMGRVLQSPPPAQSPWRTITGGGLLAESRSNATRSEGADQSSKSASPCPKNGEHFILLAVRWCCRYPLPYRDVSDLLAKAVAAI